MVHGPDRGDGDGGCAVVTMTVRVEQRSPRERFEFMRGAVAFADEVGPRVRDELKRRAPVGQRDPRPGRLRDSIRYSRTTRPDGVRLEFTAHVPYARYVVGGTRPHLISARAARALHWIDAGGSHFARTVHHPGTAPNPFPREAMDASRLLVQVAWRRHMQGGL